MSCNVSAEHHDVEPNCHILVSESFISTCIMHILLTTAAQNKFFNVPKSLNILFLKRMFPQTSVRANLAAFVTSTTLSNIYWLTLLRSLRQSGGYLKLLLSKKACLLAHAKAHTCHPSPFATLAMALDTSCSKGNIHKKWQTGFRNLAREEVTRELDSKQNDCNVMCAR